MEPSKRGTKLTDQVQRTARKPIEHEKEDLTPLIPTGSVMLNLACGETSIMGYGRGKLVNIIGDSEAGKTLLALSGLAEVAHLSKFDHYQLYFNDVECALEFNIHHLFGKKTHERIELKHSDSIDEFQDHLYRVFDKKEPFIYVLDSLDGLIGKKEEEIVRAKLKDRLAGKKTTGSYGDGKARSMSEILRLIVKKLKNSEGLLIIISQTRDIIDSMSFSETKTRSGGRALKFYSTHEIWLARLKRLTKEVRGVRKIIGSKVRAKIKKNKITGKIRDVEFDVYYDMGIDDVGSCIDFLVQHKFWKKPDSIIHAVDLDIKLNRNGLIKHIEGHNLERKLRNITQAAWLEIEELLKLDRKRKFK